MKQIILQAELDFVVMSNWVEQVNEFGRENLQSADNKWMSIVNS